MVDVNKVLKDAEESIGKTFTDEQRKTIEAFGEFMNSLFPDTESIIQEPESKTLEINEVISGLDYCLNTRRCIECEHSEGRMFVTCKPLAENALRLLKKQIPVKPIIKHMTSYPDQKPIKKIVCGACEQWALEDDALYCGNCGQAVKQIV